MAEKLRLLKSELQNHQAIWESLKNINELGSDNGDEHIETNDFIYSSSYNRKEHANVVDELSRNLGIEQIFKDPAKKAEAILKKLSELVGRKLDGTEHVKTALSVGDSFSRNMENLTSYGYPKNFVDSLFYGVGQTLGFTPGTMGDYGWELPFLVNTKKIIDASSLTLAYFKETGNAMKNRGAHHNKDAPYQVIAASGWKLTQLVQKTKDWLGSSISLAAGRFMPGETRPIDLIGETLNDKTDLFMLFVGHNDYLQSTIIAGKFDKYEYLNAMKEIIATMQKKAPHARVVVFLPVDVSVLFMKTKKECVIEAHLNGSYSQICDAWTIKPFVNNDLIPDKLALSEKETNNISDRYIETNASMKLAAEEMGAIVLDITKPMQYAIALHGNEKLTTFDGFHGNAYVRNIVELSMVNGLRAANFKVELSKDYLAKSADILGIQNGDGAQLVRAFIEDGNFIKIVRGNNKYNKTETADAGAMNILMQDYFGKLIWPKPLDIEASAALRVDPHSPAGEVAMEAGLPFFPGRLTAIRPAIQISGRFNKSVVLGAKLLLDFSKNHIAPMRARLTLLETGYKFLKGPSHNIPHIGTCGLELVGNLPIPYTEVSIGITSPINEKMGTLDSWKNSMTAYMNLRIGFNLFDSLNMNN